MDTYSLSLNEGKPCCNDQTKDNQINIKLDINIDPIIDNLAVLSSNKDVVTINEANALSPKLNKLKAKLNNTNDITTNVANLTASSVSNSVKLGANLSNAVDETIKRVVTSSSSLPSISLSAKDSRNNQL